MSKNSKFLGSTLLSLLIATAPGGVGAQSYAGSKSVGISKFQLEVGKIYYVSAGGLNLRSSNSTIAKNVIGQLSLNDQVEIYDLLNEATPLVQIKLIKSASIPASVSGDLFVSKDYLKETPTGSITGASKYFVIQNVATEKTRVYERCTESPDCAHKLVLETDMVVGRPEEGTKHDKHAFKTWLGHSKISEWVKFYQDGSAHYPHWYRAGQNIRTIPAPIRDSSSLLGGSSNWMVKDSKGRSTIYGAFGWYAGKLTPADDVNGVNYQWLHGTIGWGRDGDAAIEATRGFLINVFSNPGSSGCTRLENRAVAYLRHILPVGTDIYRVYARESTREKEEVTGIFTKKVKPLPRYADKFRNPGKWNWILTTIGAQQSGGLTADADTVLSKGLTLTPGVNVLEQGTYTIDQYPNAVQPTYKWPATSGKTGDRYEIDSGFSRDAGNSSFSGYFLVDEGRFIDYRHPVNARTRGVIRVSGLPEFRNSVPEFLKTSGTHYPPEIEYRSENQDH